MRYLTISEVSATNTKEIERRLAEQDDQRKAMAIAAFEAQHIAINEETFKALESAVKQRTLVAPPPPLPNSDVLTQLAMLQPALSLVLLPDAMKTWSVLLDTLRTIRDRRLPVGVQRAQEWAKVSGPTDETFRRVEAALRGLAEEAEDHEVKEALDALVREAREEPMVTRAIPPLLERLIGITRDPVLGAHTLQRYLVAIGQQTLLSLYSSMEYGDLPLKKWFPSVNREHLLILKKIWNQETLLVRPFSEFLTTSSALPAKRSKGGKGRKSAAAAAASVEGAVVRTAERLALDRFTAALGPVLSAFVLAFRPSLLVTEKEWSTILCFVCVSAIESLLTSSSLVYADAASLTKKDDATIFFSFYFSDVLHAAEAYSDRYQRSPEEIRRTLRVREEIEKSLFTRRFETLDKSLRDVEIVKKQLKLGDWAQGKLENLVNYKSSTVAFQLGQIKDLGIDDFGVHIGGEAPRAETAAERVGFRALAPTTAAEGGYQNRETMDEDAH